jgi:BirA family biotin operon repressor/biotin-[acetyl-CoA-carboxylase] ligase
MKSTLHLHFDTLDSTNTWAKKNIDQWSPVGVTLVTASHQTAARGRLNRSWLAPKDENLYATFCLFINERADLGHFTQVAALSAAQVIEETGIQPRIKWPNDLFVNEKKIAGILTEAVYWNEKKCLIIGMGININMSQPYLAQIGRPATSLFAETEQRHCVGTICKALDYRFNQLLGQFLKEGFAPLYPFFIKKIKHQPGDTIVISNPNEVIDGTFRQICQDGTIELNCKKDIKRFKAGEII